MDKRREILERMTIPTPMGKFGAYGATVDQALAALDALELDEGDLVHAVTSGYCTNRNGHKVLDPELVADIVAAIIAAREKKVKGE